MKYKYSEQQFNTAKQLFEDGCSFDYVFKKTGILMSTLKKIKHKQRVAYRSSPDKPRHNAKLDREQVEFIRSKTDWSSERLARKFKIGRTTVQNIKSNLTYKMWL